MGRFRHLRKNVGWLGILQLAFVHLFLLIAAVSPLLTEQMPWYLSAVIVVCWTIPLLFRRSMVDGWEVFGPFLRRCGQVLVYGSMAAGLASKQIKLHVPEEVLICTLAALISLYISAMFWFASDRSIEIEKKKR